MTLRTESRFALLAVLTLHVFTPRVLRAEPPSGVPATVIATGTSFQTGSGFSKAPSETVPGEPSSSEVSVPAGNPWTETREEFTSGGPQIQARLSGTLTMPVGDGAPYPSMVLISESGPIDRDESWGNENGTFRELARSLATRGIATLRYDPRGFGESTGNFLDAGIYDFGQDATAALIHLSTRQGVDPNRLFLLGHGYGAKVALIAALRYPLIAGVVLLAGILDPEPTNLNRALKFQHEVEGISPEDTEKALADRNYFIQNLVNGRYCIPEDYFNDPALAQWISQGMIVNPQGPAWWRDNLIFNAEEAAQRIYSPILAILGQNDWIVPAERTQEILQGIRVAGKTNLEVQILEGLDHRFIWMSSRRKAFQFDKDLLLNKPEASFPISDQVPQSLETWIRERTGEKAAPGTPSGQETPHIKSSLPDL